MTLPEARANAAVAGLPMYDWPHLRGATDRFWALIRDRLRGAGLQAPEHLARDGEPEALWTDRSLVLAQTCGLPYALALHHMVALVGTPDYGLAGCPPGHYRSAIVVRREDARERLEAFRGSAAAVNSTCSQSGFAAILASTAPMAAGAPFFGAKTVTGSHAQSIRAVASGEAEIAAIDAVTWRLAAQSMAEAAELRVLDWTEPTPGLPLITGQVDKACAISAALAEAFEILAAADRATLGIEGVVRFARADYTPLAARFRAASEAHGLRVP